jgi:hypothetical protein
VVEIRAKVRAIVIVVILLIVFDASVRDCRLSERDLERLLGVLNLQRPGLVWRDRW